MTEPKLYGYDVRAELVGELGSVFLRAPVHSETHTALSAKLAYAPDWRPRASSCCPAKAVISSASIFRRSAT